GCGLSRPWQQTISGSVPPADQTGKELSMDISPKTDQASVMGNTMLIVDDDAINRGLLSLIFSPYYHIQEAEDGPSGLAAVLDGPERLCAVLLDVVMPGLDGLQVLERLAE